MAQGLEALSSLLMSEKSKAYSWGNRGKETTGRELEMENKPALCFLVYGTNKDVWEGALLG